MIAYDYHVTDVRVRQNGDGFHQTASHQAGFPFRLLAHSHPGGALPYGFVTMYNIYVVTAKGKAMKIGIALDVRKRVQELQIGNHEKLRVSAVIPGLSLEQARYIERRCHEEMKKRQWHRRGEWFIPEVRKCVNLLRSLADGSEVIGRKEYESERGGIVSGGNMADSSRNMLHVTKLREFAGWMEDNGYVPQPVPAGATFEIARWKGPGGRPMPIVYWQVGRNKEHYTTNTECTRLIRKWLRQRQQSAGYEKARAEQEQ